MKRGIWILALSGAIVLAATGIRVQWEAGSQLSEGKDAMSRGDLALAQNRFLQAARWYLPLSGTSGEALDELLALGETHFEAGRFPEAVAAFDDVRGAIFATRSWFHVDQERLELGNEGYARSLAAWKGQGVTDPETLERYRGLAENVSMPNRFWSFVMGFSFLTYVLALARVASRWHRTDVRRWPLLSAAGLGLVAWVLSLFMI